MSFSFLTEYWKTIGNKNLFIWHKSKAPRHFRKRENQVIDRIEEQRAKFFFFFLHRFIWSVKNNETKRKFLLFAICFFISQNSHYFSGIQNLFHRRNNNKTKKITSEQYSILFLHHINRLGWNSQCFDSWLSLFFFVEFFDLNFIFFRFLHYTELYQVTRQKKTRE